MFYKENSSYFWGSSVYQFLSFMNHVLLSYPRHFCLTRSHKDFPPCIHLELLLFLVFHLGLSWVLVKVLNIYWPYEKEFIYQREMRAHVYIKTCNWMFIALNHQTENKKWWKNWGKNKLRCINKINRTLFSNKKKYAMYSNNMDESQNNFAERIQTKEYILYDPTYTKF